MSRARFLLGLDGGNTKTIALVGRLDGTIVGAARVHRSSDIYTVSLDAAVATFHDVADRALCDAGASDSSLAAAAFSLAGADWPEDFAVLDERLDERWPIRSVVNDAMGALAAAIPKGPGVVIACGTGAATGARGIDGRTWHASFWQEPQGAYELGVRTLRAVYRAELGIDPPTDLTGRVLTATGERDVESLLHHATGRSVVGRRDPAVLAWVLLDAAEAGDATARAIVARHGAELGRTALAAARRVALGPADPFGLAMVGGVIRHPSLTLPDAIVASVRRGAPAVSVVTPALEPAAGALILAFERAAIPVDETVLGRLRDSLPAESLFDTHPLRVARE